MPGWGWLIVGIVLLSIEMFVIDAQFYLVFLGAAAGVVGVLAWAGLPLSPSLQWWLFAGLSVLAMLTFRKRLYQRLRKPAEPMSDALTVGERVQLPELLAPGQSCRVEYRGSSWTARNAGSEPLQGEAVIVAVEGLVLLVRAA